MEFKCFQWLLTNFIETKFHFTTGRQTAKISSTLPSSLPFSISLIIQFCCLKYNKRKKNKERKKKQPFLCANNNTMFC
uniref:Uncharacterized protein n=1 Tax=Octopus bimaculoides TaxID=37653 RepID=A0A0L8IHM6_OCTBM